MNHRPGWSSSDLPAGTKSKWGEAKTSYLLAKKEWLPLNWRLQPFFFAKHQLHAKKTPSFGTVLSQHPSLLVSTNSSLQVAFLSVAMPTGYRQSFRRRFAGASAVVVMLCQMYSRWWLQYLLFSSIPGEIISDGLKPPWLGLILVLEILFFW